MARLLSNLGIATAFLATAAVLSGVTVAQAQGIRDPLQATVTTQLYESAVPAGPIAVRPLSDTADNERLIDPFKEAIRNIEREVADSAPLIVEFDGEVVWDYRARSSLASQHLNANLANRSSAFSASENREFRVLGMYEQGDTRLPAYRLTAELKLYGQVVWRGQALSNPTSLTQDRVMGLMVDPLIELLKESVENEVFYLE